MKTIDVAIIGAGTAGINAQRAATRAGATAIMFDAGPLGTTCARVGCMPSKLLIAAAEHVHSAKHASDFGIAVGEIRVDGALVMRRVQGMRDGFVNATLVGIERIEANGGLVRENVEMLSPNEFMAGGERYSAKSIVVATGSTPWVPPPFRDLGALLLTTDQVFELETLPESLLVVGAGVIGMELALAFARLGVRVSVVEMDGRLAGISDPEIREYAYETFSQELDLNTNYQFKRVEVREGQVQISFHDDSNELRDEHFDFALMATGRKPKLSGMGLEMANLGSLQEIQASIDESTGQVGTSHFFMAGDVTGTHTLLHEAGHEGRMAGTNAAQWPTAPTPKARLTPLGVVFSDPQIATVGLDYSALPSDVLVASFDFKKQGRAKVLGRDQGLMKVYASRDTGKLLGATIFGPDAEYLGHLLAWSIESEKTAGEVLNFPFYHPTIVEAFQSVLRTIVKQVGEES